MIKRITLLVFVPINLLVIALLIINTSLLIQHKDFLLIFEAGTIILGALFSTKAFLNVSAETDKIKYRNSAAWALLSLVGLILILVAFFLL